METLLAESRAAANHASTINAEFIQTHKEVINDQAQ